MQTKDEKSPASFRLGERSQEKLKEIAERWHCSQGSVIDHGVHLLADPDLCASLGDGFQAMEQSLRAWEVLLDKATEANAKAFSRAEWNYLADVNNGLSPLLMVAGGGGENWAQMHLLADAEDAHRLDQTGDKWFAEGKPADKAVAELCRKLRDLDHVHGWAAAIAIQFFWQHTEPGEINHSKDEWWTLQFRRKLLRGDKP